MKNYQQTDDLLTIAVSNPTAPVSGDPVRIGSFCGVAVADVRADGKTVVRVRGVVNVTVKAVDGSGNSAVAAGDKLYYVDADTPKLSKKSSGTFFGYALGAVSAGQTGSIDVLLAN
jgi:predicted RecA/RadA family phage recombinase